MFLLFIFTFLWLKTIVSKFNTEVLSATNVPLTVYFRSMDIEICQQADLLNIQKYFLTYILHDLKPVLFSSAGFHFTSNTVSLDR